MTALYVATNVAVNVAAGGGPMAQAQAALFAILARDGGSFFDADGYAGTSDVTSLTDRIISGHTLAFGATKPALPASSAEFGGARTLTITGAEFCDSSRTGAQWGYLHRSASFFHVASITTSVGTDSTLHSTCNVLSGSTEAGSYGSLIRFTHLATAIVCNGTGSPANGRTVNSTEAQGAFAADNVASYVIFSLNAADTPDWSLRVRGSVVASGDFAGGGASAGDAARTLRMFQNHGATPLAFVGKWHCSGFKPTPFTAAELAVVQNYIRLKTGGPP